MFLKSLNRGFAVGLLLLGGWIATSTHFAWGQAEISRKAKFKVAPVYPELARHMSITGVVKIEITVSTNGSVKRRKGGWRASGVGGCGFGCGQEVALRGSSARVNRDGGIPF